MIDSDSDTDDTCLGRRPVRDHHRRGPGRGRAWDEGCVARPATRPPRPKIVLVLATVNNTNS